MNGDTNRKFNCRNEELPVICGFVADSLNRDLADFSQFSPKYSETYVSDFRSAIDAVTELVTPREETLQVKLLTEQIYNLQSELADQLNRLQAYLDMAGKSIPLSASDFGILPCRRKIHQHETEGVMQALKLVMNNVARYKTPLNEQGMSDEFEARLQAISSELSTAVQKRYELVSRRAELVQDNMGELNALFEQMNLICKTGKALYKNNNPAKTKDYTFSHLLKQIRRPKAAEPQPDENDESGINAEAAE
ncbi:hypothetical protein [Mangrovibacterium diazotrophicum]|uniref:Uncharacterized protein n=1 Tax=Mangrovibacterium diazotrophicum TaxID=1261403 RepID=A0A419W923_9BACT|nr:hypothetical protein [Mangrovibacterium diazotrophicum]RKD91978.1 hypothetical protein BC643_2347 [Mangrovibacterium diazotrophicum]